MECKMKRTMILILSVSLFLVFSACDKDITPSLYDPDATSGPQPTISSIDPPDFALAGVTIVTLTGQNFSPDPEKNFVYFDDQKGQIQSASATELKVKPPNLVGDSVAVKIAVHGAELFSNTVIYKLEYTEFEYGGVDKFTDAYSLACDPQNNIYVSSGLRQILKITPVDPDENTVYVPVTDGFYQTMCWGPDDYLYAGRTRFIYRVPPGGGSIDKYGDRLRNPVNDIDFGPNHNLFIAGRNSLMRMKPDGTVDEVMEYERTILSAIRVYDGYVYVSGEYYGNDPDATVRGIWRNEITSDDGAVGPTEEVFDWDAAVGETGADINDITFDIDGFLYIGAEYDNAIYYLIPQGAGDYAGSELNMLYPDILKAPATAFVWDNDIYLYVNRKSDNPDEQKLLRVTMAKLSAPYYGRQ
jgi:hypothetical protein